MRVVALMAISGKAQLGIVSGVGAITLLLLMFRQPYRDVNLNYIQIYGKATELFTSLSFLIVNVSPCGLEPRSFAALR